MAISKLVAARYPQYVETDDDLAMERAEVEDATDFGFEDGMDDE